MAESTRNLSIRLICAFFGAFLGLVFGVVMAAMNGKISDALVSRERPTVEWYGPHLMVEEVALKAPIWGTAVGFGIGFLASRRLRSG